MGYGHSTLVEKAISISNFPFIHFNTEDQKHFKLFLSHFCFLPFATHVNLCTNLHIHTYYHDYFLYFLLRCKPNKFLALILKLKQSQCPPGTMTLHYLPCLCRIRTENSLAVGKAGERIPNKKTNKMPQTKKQKPVTQNKILFCSRFTAQQEIFVLACRQERGPSRTAYFHSWPEDLEWNVCEIEPHAH